MRVIWSWLLILLATLVLSACHYKDSNDNPYALDFVDKPHLVIEEPLYHEGVAFCFRFYDRYGKPLEGGSIEITGNNRKYLGRGVTDKKGTCEFTVPYESPVTLLLDGFSNKVIFRDYKVKNSTRYTIAIMFSGAPGEE
jgi:hypothetical protein